MLLPAVEDEIVHVLVAFVARAAPVRPVGRVQPLVDPQVADSAERLRANGAGQSRCGLGAVARVQRELVLDQSVFAREP